MRRPERAKSFAVTGAPPGAPDEQGAPPRRQQATSPIARNVDERLARQAPTLGALLVVGESEPTPDSASSTSITSAARIRLPSLLRRIWRSDDPPSPLPGGAYVYPILQRVTTLGRALTNAVTLLDTTVSREHAHLHWQAGSWWVENVTEQNPLWVAGRLTAPGERAPISPGDILRLGHTRLRLLAIRPPAHGADSVGASSPTDRPTQPPSHLPAASADVAAQERASLEVMGMTDEAEATGDAGDAGDVDGWGAQAVAVGASGTGLLSPGVTLQFALRERLSPRARWALGALCVVVFLVSALLTLGVVSLVGQDALASGGWRQALAALTLPLIPALGVALLVAALDRYEREPVVVLFAAFLWGAVIAIPPTLFVERGVNAALAPLLAAALRWVGAAGAAVNAHAPLGVALTAAFQAANAGVTEEALKGVGLLLLLLALRDEFDNVTDGLIYGALIGAGFAMVENIVYFAAAPRADLGFLIVGRVALGWLSHSTFTALFGAGLGFARETHYRRWRWLAPLAGLAAAILLHTWFDSVAFVAEGLAQGRMSLAQQPTLLTVATLLAEYGPLFLTQLALLWVALRALRREAATVRAYLADEVMRGVVTPDEYIVLQDATLRGAAERHYGLTYGPRVYLTARAFYQTATGLAFRKWHVAMGDAPKRGARQPEDAYRERIPRLRRSLERQVRVKQL